MNKLLLIFIALLSTRLAIAQDSSAVEHKLLISGYIKDLQTFTFEKKFIDLISGNLIHNRMNVKWKPTDQITGAVEIRSRLFLGKDVKISPDFNSHLENENQAIDLQKIWIDSKSLLLVTNVERLYVDYGNDLLNVRLGRQRINWGLNTTWNPNDIFNSYSFLDFDYEERSGVDAGKISYKSVNTEFAYAYMGKNFGSIAALKFSFNKYNYDTQLIVGWYRDHPTVGAGWAGSIEDVGFKGEFQYYFLRKVGPAHINFAIEGDYMFNKGWYLNLGLLFNNQGINKPLDTFNQLNLGFSPVNLMPTKWNMIVACTKQFNPLLSVNMSVLYAPGANLAIFYPFLQYNFATNLDLDLIWQSIYAAQSLGFTAIKHHATLRLKWSF